VPANQISVPAASQRGCFKYSKTKIMGQAASNHAKKNGLSCGRTGVYRRIDGLLSPSDIHRFSPTFSYGSRSAVCVGITRMPPWRGARAVMVRLAKPSTGSPRRRFDPCSLRHPVVARVVRAPRR
jgi:hypothetical protein